MDRMVRSESSMTGCPFSSSLAAGEEKADPFSKRWDPVEHAKMLCPIPGAEVSEDLPELARRAWRHSNRCIGRAQWKALETLDARSATTCEEVFAALRKHLQKATNGGRIRSVLTCFQKWAGRENEIRIWNHQLLRYAGYEAADGTVLGDPMNRDLTRIAMSLGWTPPASRSAFDLLPVIVQVGDCLRCFEWEKEDVLEVRFRHPKHDFFESLDLKWYAVPAISDMIFATGDRLFPCAPFNGHYMGTEIGARDLGDAARYNLLPVIAEKLDLDTNSSRSLWKDHALLVLNEAVLWSFEQDGVRITDHHRASEDFLKFCEGERKVGRKVNADWSWIVPPMSGSVTGVFHRGYDSGFEFPNFLPQVKAWETKRGVDLLVKNAKRVECLEGLSHG